METDTETAYYQQSPIHTTTNMSNNNNNCAMLPNHQGMLPDGNYGNHGNHAQAHPQQLPSMCSYYSQPHTLTVSKKYYLNSCPPHYLSLFCSCGPTIWRNFLRIMDIYKN